MCFNLQIQEKSYFFVMNLIDTGCGKIPDDFRSWWKYNLTHNDLLTISF